MEVKINCAVYQSAPLSLLKPVQGELKELSELNFERLKAEILDEGFIAPFFIWVNDGDKYLLDGHQRHRTLTRMKEQGIKMPDDFPVYEIYAETYRQACKRVLALSSQYGLMTKQGLYEFAEKNDLTEELERYNFDAFPMEEFKQEYYDSSNSDEIDETDDDCPNIEDKNIYVKNGDLWFLNNHRVLCGDSTVNENYNILLEKLICDITFTSPPYNVSTQGFQEAKYKSGFENKSDEEYLNFCINFTEICLEKSKYVFVNNQFLSNNRFTIVDYQYYFKNFLKDILIWNKQIAPPNIVKGAFNTKWEYVFSFSKDNKTRGFPCSWRGKYFNVIDTISNSSNKFAKIHKAGFPIELPIWILEKMDFCKNVLDPFLGTGTTLIASEKLGKNSFALEIEPIYVQTSIERYVDFMEKENKEYKILCKRNGKTYSIDQLKT